MWHNYVTLCYIWCISCMWRVLDFLCHAPCLQRPSNLAGEDSASMSCKKHFHKAIFSVTLVNHHNHWKPHKHASYLHSKAINSRDNRQIKLTIAPEVREMIDYRSSVLSCSLLFYTGCIFYSIAGLRLLQLWAPNELRQINPLSEELRYLITGATVKHNAKQT